ncbi:MAG: hypothetical protein LAP87_26620 [Acidobacteriia bacterium]|nr:hypothetical protein [Terriglobia bacterium]
MNGNTSRFRVIHGREVYADGVAMRWRCPACQWWRDWAEERCCACGCRRDGDAGQSQAGFATAAGQAVAIAASGTPDR